MVMIGFLIMTIVFFGVVKLLVWFAGRFYIKMQILALERAQEREYQREWEATQEHIANVTRADEMRVARRMRVIGGYYDVYDPKVGRYVTDIDYRKIN